MLENTVSLSEYRKSRFLRKPRTGEAQWAIPNINDALALSLALTSLWGMWWAGMAYAFGASLLETGKPQ